MNPTSRRWLRRYTVLTFLQGCAWGTIGPVSAYLDNNLYMMLTLFMLGGMSAGAIATRAVFFKVYLASQIPLLTPILLTLLIRGDSQSLIIAALVVIFFIFMLSVARNHGRNAHTMIQLWVDNERLVETMSRSKAELEQANRSLREEIEQRKAAEERLFEAKRVAVEANQAKNHFLANMSHEIRTPLNGIIGFSDILQKTQLSAEQEDYIHTIGRSARSLLAIVSDILDISRIEANQVGLSEQLMDLRAAVDEVVGVVSPLAGVKDILLYRDIAADVPRTIRGDEYRIKQILTNILGNGIKFTNKGYVLLTVSLAADAGRTNILFTFEDSGIGIAPGQQEIIFEPFRQIEAFDTRRHEGTGLGLAIAKSFVDMMGGHISLSSMQGKGTRVCVSIPCNAAVGAEGAVRLYTSLRAGLNLGNRRLAGATRHLLEFYAVPIVDDWQQADFIITDGGGVHESGLLACGIPLIILDGEKIAGQEGDNTDAVYHLPLNVSHRLMEQTFDKLLSGAKEAHIDEHATQKTLSEIKVLVVDDNAINLKVLGSFLQRNAIPFDSATGGGEALRLMSMHHYDIVLLDVQMPEISGFDVIEKLNERQQDHPPIIAVTAHAFPEQHAAMHEQGFVECLIKPVSESELLKALQRHLAVTTDVTGYEAG